MKKIFYSLLLVFLLILGFLFWQVWQNNRSIDPVSATVLQQHFEDSVSWLDSSYSTVENTPNPILWWMINQAALTSNNATLKNIYSKYKTNHLDKNPPDLWTSMFDKFYHPRIPDISVLSQLHDYQLFLLYGISCDRDLASEPAIQRQLSPAFCSTHYIHPRCVTHQLMGLRFMQRYQCGFDETVNTTIADLQQLVTSELTWDFRVGDSYIQRVLMLVETGAYNKVKPIWIKNILEAQNENGSWDDLHPVLSLGNGTVLAHTSTLPKIQKPKADFHTSTQAIWLLSLLLKETESN